MLIYLISVVDVETYEPAMLGREGEPTNFVVDCNEAVPIVAKLLLEEGEGIDPSSFQAEMVRWLVKNKGYQILHYDYDFHIPAAQATITGWMHVGLCLLR